ncbi:ABC transporter permease [Pseudonocardia sp. CA-107938]|uniref:ABC transporter permease n=1 Tax=Pseudonocardia sp. CA-107938 TaxID=3240021 RepID=UPI003D8B3E04
MLSPYARLVRAGFLRHSTYRTATLAGLATNTVFGLLRVSVLLAVVAASGSAAGYDAAGVGTFVWLGQGLLAVVVLWGDPELSQRVRSGDVAVDLARPVNLQFTLLATDLGRAGHALLWRFVPPVVFGALVLPLRWPTSPGTLVLFAVTVVLAVALSSTVRFLVELTSFWLLDGRGVRSLYAAVSGVLAGLTVPLAFFPDGVRAAVYATPFPGLLQTPIDVFSERGPTWALVGHQVLWLAGATVMAQVALARATRKLVVQGG